MHQELLTLWGSWSRRTDSLETRVELIERSLLESFQTLEDRLLTIVEARDAEVAEDNDACCQTNRKHLDEPSSLCVAANCSAELQHPVTATTAEAKRGSGSLSHKEYEKLLGEERQVWSEERNGLSQQLADAIAERDRALEKACITATGDVDDEPPRTTVVEVVVQKAGPDDFLGMDVTHMYGHLIVQQIFADGAVDRTNQACLQQVPAGDTVEIGDIIFQVNDITEPDAAVVEECRCATTLRIRAMRF